MKAESVNLPDGRVRIRVHVTAEQGESIDDAKARAFRAALDATPDTHRAADQRGFVCDVEGNTTDRLYIDPEANRGGRRTGSRRIFLSLICEKRE